MSQVRLAPQAVVASGAHAPGAHPVLDIGEDVGALVVYLAEDTPSGELEACPEGRPADHFHTGVHPRAIGGEAVFTAVFPEVVRGSYQVLDDGGIPLACVHVIGGRVAELDLRGR